MIFTIENEKYDTEKMELISDKVKKRYKRTEYITLNILYNCNLYKTKKGKWLLTHIVDDKEKAEIINSAEAKELLVTYDKEAHEKKFKKRKGGKNEING